MHLVRLNAHNFRAFYGTQRLDFAPPRTRGRHHHSWRKRFGQDQHPQRAFLVSDRRVHSTAEEPGDVSEPRCVRR